MSSVRVISSKDPEVKHLIEDLLRWQPPLSSEIQQFWVCIEQSTPFGFVLLGQEPDQLLAAPGTKFLQIIITRPIDPEIMREVIVESKKIGDFEKVGYLVTDVSANESAMIAQINREGFEVFDDAYGLIYHSDNQSTKSQKYDLTFQESVPVDQDRFVEYVRTFLQGSLDPRIQKTRQYLSMVPSAFWFDSFQPGLHFFVIKNEETIGVLSIDAIQGLITNVAVAPSYRGQGYGQKIIRFALQKLGKVHCRIIRLRVHKDNLPALRLYEHFNFQKEVHWLTLLLRTELNYKNINSNEF